MEILTPTGFQKFHGVKKSIVNEILELEFYDGKILKCTPNHLIYQDGSFVEAKDITFVKSKRTLSGSFDVYDPIEVENGHQYYSNEIVSHNCSFLGSSDTLISGKKLSTLFFETALFEDSNLKIYKNPIPDHTYVCTVDSSRGSGNDYHAFIVFDVTQYPYEIVATFRNNEMSHLVYPQYIYEVAKQFNEAFLLIETNDIGQVIADIMFDEFEYENMFMSQTKGRGGQQIGASYGSVHGPIYGVRTTTPVKRIGCVNLKSLVENDKLVINDEKFLWELQRFVQKRKSFEAEEGATDDLVMCGVLFAWLVHQEYFKDIVNNDIRQVLKADNEKFIFDSLTPFGFVFDAAEEMERELKYQPETTTVWNPWS